VASFNIYNSCMRRVGFAALRPSHTESALYAHPSGLANMLFGHRGGRRCMGAAEDYASWKPTSRRGSILIYNVGGLYSSAP
jgi:hypothetical protein